MTDPLSRPTEEELGLAACVIVTKTVRLFFDTPETEPRGEGVGRMLLNWAKVPQERREAALLEFQRLIWAGVAERLEKGHGKTEVIRPDAKW